MGGLRKSQAPSSIKKRNDAELMRLREQEERDTREREQARLLEHARRIHSLVLVYQNSVDNHSFNNILQFLCLKDIANLVTVLVLNDKKRRPCIFVPPDAALGKLLRGALDRQIFLDVRPTLIHTSIRLGIGRERGVLDRTCTLPLLKDMKEVIKHVPLELQIPRWLDDEEGGGVQFSRLLSFDQAKLAGGLRRSVDQSKRRATVTWSLLEGGSKCVMKAELPGGGLVRLSLDCARCEHLEPKEYPWEGFQVCDAVVLKDCRVCEEVCASCSRHAIECEVCEQGVCAGCHVRLPAEMCRSCGFLCSGCDRVLDNDEIFYCQVGRDEICVNGLDSTCEDCVETLGNSRFCHICEITCCLPCFNAEINPRSFQCMNCPSRLCNCAIGVECKMCAHAICEACCENEEPGALAMLMLGCDKCGKSTCHACNNGAPQPPCETCQGHYCNDCSSPTCPLCNLCLCPCQFESCSKCHKYLSCRQCLTDGRTLCKRCTPKKLKRAIT